MQNARRQRPLETLGKRVESAGAGINNPRHKVRDDLVRNDFGTGPVEIGFVASPRGRSVVVDIALGTEHLTYVLPVFRKPPTKFLTKIRDRALAGQHVPY